MSEYAKITAGHRQRRAVVYVRQSTPGQVERNTESGARQYALAERAVELGWPAESVVVVDEDTGRSAAWARSRIGFRELHAEQQLLPRRTVGEQRVRWELPSFAAVHDLLTNPVYAGAFVFGRARQRKTVDPDGQLRTRTELLPISQWRVCLPDHHPGYITWDDDLTTRERLRTNARARGEGGGAAREGSALLQGLIRCGRCGRRMMVAYSGERGRAGRYLCSRTFQQQGTRRPCQAIGALRVDRAVTQAFLDAVSPAGLDATAHALQTLQSAHDERVRLQRLAVERAAYQAERARRQYDACEPENRLVARTLEHALEAALTELDTQQRAARELEHRRPAPLSDEERRVLARLAGDLPRVWEAPTTTDRDRKQLLRCLLDDVVLTVDREHHHARLELFWQGGAHTELDIALNRTPAKRTDTSEELLALIRRLATHSSDAEIAMILAKQGAAPRPGSPSPPRA